jgi:hypothetical protein
MPVSCGRKAITAKLFRAFRGPSIPTRSYHIIVIQEMISEVLQQQRVP